MSGAEPYDCGILSSIIIEAEKKGEFRPLLIKDVNEILHGLL
jgi:hypothetical protein